MIWSNVCNTLFIPCFILLTVSRLIIRSFRGPEITVNNFRVCACPPQMREEITANKECEAKSAMERATADIYRLAVLTEAYQLWRRGV